MMHRFQLDDASSARMMDERGFAMGGEGGETNPSRILEIEWKESVDDKRVMNS